LWLILLPSTSAGETSDPIGAAVTILSVSLLTNSFSF